jgi:hypothetical protein
VLVPASELVLHDMFATPFDEVARIIDRSRNGPAARKPRSPPRARCGAGSGPRPGHPAATRRRFLPAREGDFDALVAVLDPDVVLKVDLGAGASQEGRGAEAVAGRALNDQRRARFARPALINGTPGIVELRDGKLYGVHAFTVSGGKIVELDILADRRRLSGLDVAVLDD